MKNRKTTVTIRYKNLKMKNLVLGSKNNLGDKLKDLVGNIEEEANKHDYDSIYLITNRHFKNYVKVGITGCIKDRILQYQAYDPTRSFTIEFIIKTKHAAEIEKEICRLYSPNSEWIKGYTVRVLQDKIIQLINLL